MVLNPCKPSSLSACFRVPNFDSALRRISKQRDGGGDEEIGRWRKKKRSDKPNGDKKCDDEKKKVNDDRTWEVIVAQRWQEILWQREKRVRDTRNGEATRILQIQWTPARSSSNVAMPSIYLLWRAITTRRCSIDNARFLASSRWVRLTVRREMPHAKDLHNYGDCNG